MILSHGFGTDHRSWRLLLPDLLKQFDVGVYDLAGAGPNGRQNFEPDRHTSILSYADDLLALLDEQKITSCQILTHSVSGMVALLAARQRPDLFSRIFMIAASPRYINEADYTGGFTQTDLDGLFDAMHSGYESWANGFAPIIVGEPLPEYVREFTAGLLNMPVEVAIQTAKFIFQSDFRHILPEIDVPTVLIQPKNDPAVPVAVGEFLKDQLRNSTLDVIDARGHLPHLTAPYAVLHCLHKAFAEPVHIA
jgi:sigma-B regulation protein RsbQ